MFFKKFIILSGLLLILTSCGSKPENIFSKTIDILGKNKLNDGQTYIGATSGRSWWTFDEKRLKLEYTTLVNGNVKRAVEEYDIENFDTGVVFDKEIPRYYIYGDFGNYKFRLRFKKVFKGDYVSYDLGKSDKNQYAIRFEVEGNNWRSTWDRFIDLNDKRGEKLYELFYDVKDSDANESLDRMRTEERKNNGLLRSQFFNRDLSYDYGDFKRSTGGSEMIQDYSIINEDNQVWYQDEVDNVVIPTWKGNLSLTEYKEVLIEETLKDVEQYFNDKEKDLLLEISKMFNNKEQLLPFFSSYKMLLSYDKNQIYNQLNELFKDSDDDGIPDTREEYEKLDPLNSDTDGDGIDDGSDLHPLDPKIYPEELQLIIDTDSDGVSDINEGYVGTDPKNPDSDNDGVVDGSDDFPLDPKETDDFDGDGIGNNSDPFPDDPLNGELQTNIGEYLITGFKNPLWGEINSQGKILEYEDFAEDRYEINDRSGSVGFGESMTDFYFSVEQNTALNKFNLIFRRSLYQKNLELFNVELILIENKNVFDFTKNMIIMEIDFTNEDFLYFLNL